MSPVAGIIALGLKGRVIGNADVTGPGVCQPSVKLSAKLVFMEPVDRLGIFERLKHAIQLLACPPEIQLMMLPPFVCKADELALDFDNWRDAVLGNFRSELSTDQLSSLENIDRTLSELTSMGPEHWTEDAVCQSGEWKRVRTLAAAALESFGWARDIPPSHADEYVGEK